MLSYAQFASKWDDGTIESEEKHKRRLKAYFEAEADDYFKDVVSSDKSNLYGLILEFLFERHEEGNFEWADPNAGDESEWEDCDSDEGEEEFVYRDYLEFSRMWDDGTPSSVEKHKRCMEAYFYDQADGYFKDQVAPDKSNLDGLIFAFLMERHEEGDQYWYGEEEEQVQQVQARQIDPSASSLARG